jgi:tetratricopeptide (TPR) repeat protein
MLELFGDGANNLTTLNLVRACALAPGPLTDPADLVRRAEKVVAREYVHWHLYVEGLVHYRAGQYAEAVKSSRQSLSAIPEWNARAINYPVLAMALHHLGKADEARQALASAEKAIDQWTETMFRGPVDSMPIPWIDWIECRLLYREATQLLTGVPPAEDPRLRTIQERARAAIHYGDATAWLDRGRAHALRGEADKAAASFAEALDRLPVDVLGLEHKRSPICTDMVPATEAFAKLLEVRPHDVRLWISRAQSHARKGQWDKATADYGKVVELEPSVAWHWYHLALSHLGAGQPEEYRRVCAAMVARFGEAEDAPVLIRVVYTCLYLPDAVPDPAQLVDVAARAVKGSGSSGLSGAALCRAGKFAEAVPPLEQAMREDRVVCKAWEWLFAALAHQHLGHTEQARRYLTQSRQWMEEADRHEPGVGPGLWIDPYQRVEVHQLYREADGLITATLEKGKTP